MPAAIVERPRDKVDEFAEFWHKNTSWSNSDAPTPVPEAASQPKAQDSIAPANWTATSATSRRVAAPTPSPARSRGICMKTPATCPCARRNAGICAGLSPSKENRDAAIRSTSPRARAGGGRWIVVESESGIGVGASGIAQQRSHPCRHLLSGQGSAQDAAMRRRQS